LYYKIGIDVGSTTLKTVILNEKDEIIEKSYQRHFSKVREMTLEHFKSLKDQDQQVLEFLKIMEFHLYKKYFQQLEQ